MWAFVPFDRKCIQGGLGVPPGVSHHSDGTVIDTDDFFDAFATGDGGSIEAFELAPEHRAILDRRVQHARQLQVDAVHLGAGGLVDRIKASQPLAGKFPISWVFECHAGRLRQFACRRCHLAIGRGPPARHVGDDTIGCSAVRRRNLPLISRRLNQHRACNGTTLAHIVLRIPDATAAAGAEITPDPITGQALSWCWVFGGDFRPIAFEFFCNQLGQASQRALTHFRAGNSNHHTVVRAYDYPGVHLGRSCSLCRGVD